MNSSELGFLFWDKYREKTGIDGRRFYSARINYFRILLLAVLVIIVLRLFWLQIIQGKRNRVLSEENRIYARLIQAPRGVITDRTGKVIVQNIPVYKRKNTNCDGTLEKSNNENCKEFIEISREEALELEASGRGDQVLTFVGRSYVYGPEIAHVVGYVGEMDVEEIEKYGDYSMGTLVGKMGIELEYEELLHGIDGAELVEVDVFSEVLREVARKEPKPGQDIALTIDERLQSKAWELLDQRAGGLVAIDPRNGEVLTLVSTPSFDPNEVAVSLDREDKPFFNRVFGGLYPPGSVFKVVTAISGLEEGKINRDTEFEDTGEIRIGIYRYGNWYFDQYGRKEGSVNLIKGIKRSNDIYFYRVGELVGAKKLSEWAKVFGYGQKTGIDLPGEAEGLVPSPLWKERIRGERWFLGNTYHFAIGQSDLQVTPLQVAQMTAGAATGKLCRPHMISDMNKSKVGVECRDLGIKKENLDLVREGMVEVCMTGGTAFPFFNFKVDTGEGLKEMKVACKTGTAQFGDPKDRTHAWFTVYAPVEDPEIVVTVLLEKAGEGSYEAAPVAKEFLEYYFGEVAN